MLQETYLVFQCTEHSFAVENNKVVRILPADQVWSLPMQSESIRGLMLLDDQLVAVIDVESLLFHQKAIQENYIIVIRFHEEFVAVCATRIMGMRVIEEGCWQSTDCEALPYSGMLGGSECYYFNLDTLWGGDTHD